MRHGNKYPTTTENSQAATILPQHAVIDRRSSWLFAGCAAMLLAALMTALQVKAEVYDSRDYQRQSNAYVTVYEDCDYRGSSREISVGDYQNIRHLGLSNDSISSIRVANGLEVELFQDERFRGASASIDTDVSCLNRQWNDQASSLRVSYDDSRQYNDNARNNDRYNNRNDDFGGDDRYQNRNENNGRNRGNANNGYRGRDFTKSVSRIEFANFVLAAGQGNRWSMSNRDGPNQSYTETGRDNRVIYLRNDRTRQTLDLNVYSSKATVISPKGRQTDYQITQVGKGSGRSPRAQDRIPTVTPNPNSGGSFGVVKGSCFTYKAYARGGRGGIKFPDKNIKQQFDDDAETGRVCHSGSLVMELTKTDRNVDVFVEIQGRTYKFAKGEKEDFLLNSWYRKMIKLKVTG
ncbi:MAG: hypothetical protein ACI9WC_000873 [Arenicella sp.]|jgi:hypothetical protein